MIVQFIARGSYKIAMRLQWYKRSYAGNTNPEYPTGHIIEINGSR